MTEAAGIAVSDVRHRSDATFFFGEAPRPAGRLRMWTRIRQRETPRGVATPLTKPRGEGRKPGTQAGARPATHRGEERPVRDSLEPRDRTPLVFGLCFFALGLGAAVDRPPECWLLRHSKDPHAGARARRQIRSSLDAGWADCFVADIRTPRGHAWRGLGAPVMAWGKEPRGGSFPLLWFTGSDGGNGDGAIHDGDAPRTDPVVSSRRRPPSPTPRRRGGSPP